MLSSIQPIQLKNTPLADDLDYILAQTENLWQMLRGQRLFITGGTGFFGKWLLESLVWANYKFQLDVSAMILTRNYRTFQREMPHLANNPAITFHPGDVRDFKFPRGEFSHIIHAAATSARATFNNEDPLVKFDTIVQGTRHTLDFALACGAKKFLYTSSGAVYGKQPVDMSHVPEDYLGAPNPVDPNSAWGQAKRSAEFLCGYYAKYHGLQTKIARCFSFAGPYLPLDIHYAIGNFIYDGLNRKAIVVKGDGSPYRAYLYVADLIIWLWVILLRGETGEVYNVGSDQTISIKELAYLVSECFNPAPNVIIKQNKIRHFVSNKYVPDVSKAKSTLNLSVTIDLKTAIQKTIDFYACQIGYRK